MQSQHLKRPHVVIVGAGFGGLRVALSLKKSPVDVTVIDRSNHHLFQPLLYQVATAGLSPGDITEPIRKILRKQKNTEVLMTEVTGVDVENKEVITQTRKIPYDYLVIATGASHSYFGHPEWEANAPGLKSIQDALKIRRKVLCAFEKAELEPDSERRKAYLNFVIVGGGPTGVELAGSIAELAHRSLASDFRHIDPRSTRVLLLEAAPRILLAFPESLSQKAKESLEKLGVEIRLNSTVEKIDASGVWVQGEHLRTETVLWAAGVKASPAGKWLNGEMDRAGRVKVNPDLSLPHHPEIFVIGDTAWAMQDGKPLPGVAPVAMQQGRYVGKKIAKEVTGKKINAPFRYVNKGNLATIGRAFAVADFGKVRLSGFVAWVLWLFVHILYLAGFENRVLVLIQWAWAYLTFQRGARLIQ